MTRGIILSGGWGTRLRPLTCTIPKTLIPVCNVPVIQRQMNLLKLAGVKEIILAVSVMADYLREYFGDGRKVGLQLHSRRRRTRSPSFATRSVRVENPLVLRHRLLGRLHLLRCRLVRIPGDRQTAEFHQTCHKQQPRLDCSEVRASDEVRVRICEALWTAAADAGYRQPAEHRARGKSGARW